MKPKNKYSPVVCECSFSLIGLFYKRLVYFSSSKGFKAFVFKENYVRATFC